MKRLLRFLATIIVNTVTAIGQVLFGLFVLALVLGGMFGALWCVGWVLTRLGLGLESKEQAMAATILTGYFVLIAGIIVTFLVVGLRKLWSWLVEKWEETK